MRYARNRLYLTSQEQDDIKNCPIILAGCGVGSVIAECALRLGFENITIIDGDRVELSNLNRQNYVEEDVSNYKSEALAKRLKSINKNARITFDNIFLTKTNMESYVTGHEIAVNALDFSFDTPFLFDKTCQQLDIPVLHPYNLGWAGLVTIIAPKGPLLSSLRKAHEENNEITMVEYASSYLKFWGNPHEWIDCIVEKYKKENSGLHPPQLSIASWLVASMCTHLLFKIATKKKIKEFPEFYLSTLMN